MLKFPRAWTQWTVNLTKKQRLTRKSVVIHLAEDVVTCAYLTQNKQKKTKKRPGWRSDAPSLTQSLTLSHIHRILNTLNSSAPIAIILPKDLFTQIQLAAPTDLAPQDLAATLRWAIQQQGFSPIENWLWDAIKIPETPSEQARWELLLIEAAVVENYLQRLGLKCKQLRSLLADDQVLLAEQPLVAGPWLNKHQAQLALSYLHQYQASDAQPSTAAKTKQKTTADFNLAANLIAQTTRRYHLAFIQCALASCCVAMVASAWWLHTKGLASTELSGSIEPPVVQSLPSQPLFQHAHIWQALYALHGQTVEIQRLEFRRERWLLQIKTLDPAAADDWISQLQAKLSLLTNVSVSGHRGWRVITHASRSSEGSTTYDLEILQ